MPRIVGIVHRTKQTKQGKARPTKVAVKDLESGHVGSLDLKTETDELDWLLGRFPTAYRELEPGEDRERYLTHQVKTKSKKDAKTGEEPEITMVPSAHDGFRQSDTILMVMAGSGSSFMYALSNRGERAGLGQVFGISPHDLKAARGDDTEEAKQDDHLLLLRLWEDLAWRDKYVRIGPRQREVIEVLACLYDRQEDQDHRIAMGNRIGSRTIGAIFRNPEGEYPEGSIGDIVEERKANDAHYQRLLGVEAESELAMKRAVRKLPIWEELFAAIEGCGERIAAGIIAGVVDINRFPNGNRGKAAFKQMLGAAPTADGQFQRTRRGQNNNWNRESREALYLLAEQFNRRAGSEWGQRLLQNKAYIEERCAALGIPDEGLEVEVTEKGKTVKRKRWYKGHRHRWALWRTITKFTVFVFTTWKRLELERRAQETEKQ